MNDIDCKGVKEANKSLTSCQLYSCNLSATNQGFSNKITDQFKITGFLTCVISLLCVHLYGLFLSQVTIHGLIKPVLSPLQFSKYHQYFALFIEDTISAIVLVSTC